MPRGQQVNVSNTHLLLAESPHCKGSWDFFPEAMALSLYFSSLSPINYEWGFPADMETLSMNITSRILPQTSARFNYKMSGDRPCKTCHHDARALWVVASTNYMPKFNTLSQQTPPMNVHFNHSTQPVYSLCRCVWAAVLGENIKPILQNRRSHYSPQTARLRTARELSARLEDPLLHVFVTPNTKTHTFKGRCVKSVSAVWKMRLACWTVQDKSKQHHSRDHSEIGFSLYVLETTWMFFTKVNTVCNPF